MKGEQYLEKVSVILTTYKRSPEMVERALVSIENQTYKNLEIIVVDDSPSDYMFVKDVENTVKKHAQVMYIKHSHNMGACVARNTGLKKATGKYVCFLDDDDEFVSNKIDVQLRKIKEDSSIAMVYCNCFLLNEETGQVSVRKQTFHNGNIYYKLLEKNFVGTTSFPLIRTKCIKKLGGFDPQMTACQDYEMWLRICKDYRVDYVEDPLVIYHYHGGEQISKNPQKRIEGLERLFEINAGTLNNNRRLWALNHSKLIPEYVSDKQFVKAWLQLCRCFIKYPFSIRYLRMAISIIKHKL